MLDLRKSWKNRRVEGTFFLCLVSYKEKLSPSSCLSSLARLFIQFSFSELAQLSALADFLFFIGTTELENTLLNFIKLPFPISFEKSNLLFFARRKDGWRGWKCQEQDGLGWKKSNIQRERTGGRAPEWEK